jgi:hypothetical protein
MKFDVTKIKPGWSLTKLGKFACPLRFAKIEIEGRGKEEPVSKIALVGRLVAVGLSDVRLTWLTKGADSRVAMTYEGAIRRAIKEEPEGYTEEHVTEAMECIQSTCKVPSFLPARETVKSYWIEERLAFDHDWNRLMFRPSDAKWWGTAEQRKATHFRYIHDFAYIDTEGVGHVQDDKSLGFKDQDPRQVHAGAFMLFRMAPGLDVVQTQYNLLGPGRVQQCGTVTHEDVKAFPSWVKAREAEILSCTDFKPVLGRDCSWCGFISECPLHQKTAGELETIPPDRFRPPATLEEAQALGLWIMTGEAVLAAAKKAARAWVEQHGAVVLPSTGKEMRLNPSNEWEGPAVDALNEIGRELLAQGKTPDEAR